ncbi:EAL domain-containing protein [Aquibium microcysteis]|uniref:EAL domain-containing protein n=1 Tax=Aquibium microcysteis TaxID=675281 RepID=UPI00165D216F|nr:EAL domain-containing protein [Aquibium microcysteis]
MAGISALFVSARSLRALGIVVWFVAALLFAGVFALAVAVQGREAIRVSVAHGIDDVDRLVRNIDTAFDELDRSVTSAPCSDLYMRQLRQIAYLPDGLSEFFHVEEGRVICTLSAERLADAHVLGSPDFVRDGTVPTTFWMDRDLGFTGLAGMSGTIVQRGNFATVIPPERISLNLPGWIDAEVVVITPDGRWWHRGGKERVHQDVLIAGAGMDWTGAGGPALRSKTCSAEGHYCISTRAYLVDVAASNPAMMLLVVVFAGLGASWATRFTLGLIRRYWSFEARFLRNLDAKSLICAYQPILEVATGRIAGCEVLVRWRDIDDTVVYPDAFLPIVARHDMMRQLTTLIVRRAAVELAERLPSEARLQVNINVFPSEIDAHRINEVFKPLRDLSDRFTIALEIIESDALPLELVQAEIERLRQEGYLIYLDDFGTGYSTIRHVAALDIDGIKLDKAFAMAPDGSVMAEMLHHAIGMVRSAGRKVVVEGVETAARLAQLRERADRVDFLQGYQISRPLDIDGFAAFVRERAPAAAAAERKAA